MANMNIGAGGGGSGYIGNSSTFNKYMVGYNVATSSDESTLTRTTNKKSSAPMSGRPKMGNGFCRITYLSAIPEANTYIFLPDLTTDGRDTIRYDGNHLINLDISGNIYQVVDGSLVTDASAYYTLDDGVISFNPESEVESEPRVTWAFDTTKNQAVIPPDSDVILSCSIMANAALGAYDDITIRLVSGYATGEFDYDNCMECCLLTDNHFNIYNEGSDVSGSFDDEWSQNVEVGTWYKVDFVFHLSEGIIQNIKLYVNDDLKGTEDISEYNLLFFNVQDTNMPIMAIQALDISSGETQASIKDFSIKYVEG